jgi:hypothetical protein
MFRPRRRRHATVALLVLLCVALALFGGTVVALLPAVPVLTTTLGPSTVLAVPLSLFLLGPPADVHRSRGPPFPAAL